MQEGILKRPLQFLHHFFHHSVSGGAIFQVLFVGVHIVDHFCLRKMRESCAISWPNLVNRTHIGVKVEKLARSAFIQPIAGTALLIQPLIFKLLHRHI